LYLGSLTKIQNLSPIGLNWPYKSRIGPKGGENEVLKSREWYYIVSMHKYYQLTLFLILIRKFD